MEQFGRIPHPHDVTGVVEDVYVGYSTNPHIRQLGSSGGLVTELLLFMLRNGLIDQALVCGMDEKKPLVPRPYLARTEAEIIASAQSKYVITPQMRMLGEIIRSEANTAIVGLPCHIHAFRKMASWRERWIDNVKLVIGLVCHRTLEINVIPDLLDLNGIKHEEVRKFSFRMGNTWPGGVGVILKNGIKKILAHDIKSAFNYMRYFYSPARCLTCIDFSAELSDISVMDPWIRDKDGNYPYPRNYSMVFTRNEKGKSILQQAKAAGSLYFDDIEQKMQISRTEMIDLSQLKYFRNLKKRIVPARIKRYRRMGRPYPEYHVHFPSPSFKDRWSERFDTLTRIPGKWEWSRHLGMRVSLSDFGAGVMTLRNCYKRKKMKMKFRDR